MHTLPSFFCATAILDTHGVGSVTGLIICLVTIASNSALTIPLNETGRRRGGLTTGTLSKCVYCILSWKFAKTTEHIRVLMQYGIT